MFAGIELTACVTHLQSLDSDHHSVAVWLRLFTKEEMASPFVGMMYRSPSALGATANADTVVGGIGSVGFLGHLSPRVESLVSAHAASGATPVGRRTAVDEVRASASVRGATLPRGEPVAREAAPASSHSGGSENWVTISTPFEVVGSIMHYLRESGFGPQHSEYEEGQHVLRILLQDSASRNRLFPRGRDHASLIVEGRIHFVSRGRGETHALGVSIVTPAGTAAKAQAPSTSEESRVSRVRFSWLLPHVPFGHLLAPLFVVSDSAPAGKVAGKKRERE